LSYDGRLENLGLSRLTIRAELELRSDLIHTFKIINGIDIVDRSLFFFSKLTVVVEEDIQVNYSKNVTDLTLRNMHLVIALLTNGIL